MLNELRKKQMSKMNFMLKQGSRPDNDQEYEFTNAFFVSLEKCQQQNCYLKIYRTFTPISSHSGPGLMKE